MESVTSTVLEKWNYAYDLAGNRSYEEHAGVGTIATYAGSNRLQKRGGAGNVHVSGTVDKAAAVTVNGQPARVTSTIGGAPYRFEKDVSAATGTQTFTIAATDGAMPPQTTIQAYSIDVPPAHQTYEHDNNGNLTTVRNGETLAQVRGYQWDAANRLVKIIYTDGGSTEFQYDCLSQRRVITEKDASNTTTSVTKLLWKDGRVWQEQDDSGRVIKRYHFNGVEIITYGGANPSPTTMAASLTLEDHLRSPREVVKLEAGIPTVTGRRNYDVYGKESHLGADNEAVAYTGHYLHERSELILTLYRAYDAILGRWLSEDPIAELGGTNLYAYVRNKPLDYLDILGLNELLIGPDQTRRGIPFYDDMVKAAKAAGFKVTENCSSSNILAARNDPTNNVIVFYTHGYPTQLQYFHNGKEKTAPVTRLFPPEAMKGRKLFIAACQPNTNVQPFKHLYDNLHILGPKPNPDGTIDREPTQKELKKFFEAQPLP